MSCKFTAESFNALNERIFTASKTYGVDLLCFCEFLCKILDAICKILKCRNIFFFHYLFIFSVFIYLFSCLFLSCKVKFYNFTSVPLLGTANLRQLVVCAVSSTARPVNLEVLRRRQWDVSDGAIQTIIMGNVRCFDNKMDKLGEKIEPQRQHHK